MCVCACVFSWFHDKISRKDAEKLLVELQNPPGTFIVRESETVQGLYSDSAVHNSPVITRLLCRRRRGRGIERYGDPSVCLSVCLSQHRL